MRSILATLASLLLCASASAFEAPSALSGWYDAGDRVVRVVYSRAGSQVLIDTMGVTDAGVPSLYLMSTYAPNNCPSDSLALPLAPGLWYAVKGATATTLQVQVGAQFSVGAGIGQPQTWTLLRPLLSPSPYTCATTAPRIDPHALARYCREHPTVPACRD
jgi:hypothetical protein